MDQKVRTSWICRILPTRAFVLKHLLFSFHLSLPPATQLNITDYYRLDHSWRTGYWILLCPPFIKTMRLWVLSSIYILLLDNLELLYYCNDIIPSGYFPTLWRHRAIYSSLRRQALEVLFGASNPMII